MCIKNIWEWFVGLSNYMFLLLIAAVLSWSFFTWKNNGFVNSPAPLIINHISIQNPEIPVGGSLIIHAHNTVAPDKSNCNIYADRTISRKTDNETVWNSQSPLNVVNIKTGEVDVVVHIPNNILPGDYFYSSHVHLVCGSSVFTAVTPLLPFTIK